MKEIPILFNTEMVNAILQERKTMTRRTTGLNPINQNPNTYFFQPLLNIATDEYTFALKQPNETIFADPILRFNPPCKPGDLLWVRETWCKGITKPYHYAASVCSPKYDKPDSGWKPSIHMPKDAARIWLLVEDVRVERLHDISLIDIQNEGLPSKYEEPSPIEYFINLWSKINGAESWQSNPWVWVITFKVLSTTGKPVLRQPINH